MAAADGDPRRDVGPGAAPGIALLVDAVGHPARRRRGGAAVERGPALFGGVHRIVPIARTAALDRVGLVGVAGKRDHRHRLGGRAGRSEEHTSELQSLMRISYAVFCLKKKKTTSTTMISYIRHTIQ